jgi:SAM-dependent methyltransferase
LTILPAYAKKPSMDESEARENPTPYDVESEVESFHWWFVVRRKLLKSILSSLSVQKNSLTLDIGCGAGSNLRALMSAGLDPIGLDRSIYALSLIRSKEKFPLLAGDLNELPIKAKSVGLIIAMDILEHLHDDTNGIIESYRVLNNGGILIVTVPAFRFLWGIQDIVTKHKRRYSRREITNKLRAAGFDVLRSSYFNFFLFFPILMARRIIQLLGLEIRSENEVNFPLLNFILRTVFSLELYLLKYLPFPFGVSILCIARKNEGT